eukprot:1814183-Prymnesium_polylepis.1
MSSKHSHGTAVGRSATQVGWRLGIRIEAAMKVLVRKRAIDTRDQIPHVGDGSDVIAPSWCDVDLEALIACMVNRDQLSAEAHTVGIYKMIGERSESEL